MRLTLKREEIIRAILIEIFARTGMNLQEKDVEMNFIDDNSGCYNLHIDRVEIEILK